METQHRSSAVLAVVCVALATVVSAMASLNVALPNIARATTPCWKLAEACAGARRGSADWPAGSQRSRC